MVRTLSERYVEEHKFCIYMARNHRLNWSGYYTGYWLEEAAAFRRLYVSAKAMGH